MRALHAVATLFLWFSFVYVVSSDCFHVVPSGSKIYGVLDDGSVEVWNGITQTKNRISVCDANTAKESYRAFTISSYNTNVKYQKKLYCNATTQVPDQAPPAMGQVFHTYSTIAQPLVANDTSSFQGIEAVLQFGDYLNGPEFSDKWSIRAWYWNSQGINIMTPGEIVDPNTIIKTNLFSTIDTKSVAVGTISAQTGESQTLEMEISRPITWCVSTVEVNSLPSCSGYPPSNSISWNSIAISEDNNFVSPPYLWQQQESSLSCDLTFHTSQQGQTTTFTWNSTST